MWSHEPPIVQAAEWIRMVQNADAVGETCDSYDDPDSAASGQARPRRRHGGAGLLAAGDTRSDSVARGYGGWCRSSCRADLGRVRRRPQWRGNLHRDGFPRVFYLAYHLYRDYFPLLALTTYKRVMSGRLGRRRNSCWLLVAG